MENQLLKIIERRKLGIHSGTPSFCSANRIVIEAILEHYQDSDESVLIEATSNQVNQFGGYMNMKPADFRDYVHAVADNLSFDKERIIIGGDHLGPQPWYQETAELAMEKAKELVKQCVLSGYTKIHLDTSMKLGSDDVDKKLSDEVIAERGAALYEVAEKAFEELLLTNPLAIHPVYVIGSEVPIPGGAQEEETGLKVTSPQDFENTLMAYKKKFKERNLETAWKYIMAVVVQPGVEFGNSSIHHYDRPAARKLSRWLAKYPDLVFEGHSTDYQSPVKLREMVEDGVAILKVGPALTFALRQALFALSMMEYELEFPNPSDFIRILEETMVNDSKDWIKYYHGNELEQKIARKYSFSDRSRYYFSTRKVVEETIEKLFKNYEGIQIPSQMLYQYMPVQYKKVRDSLLKPYAMDLVKDSVSEIIVDYDHAVKKLILK